MCVNVKMSPHIVLFPIMIYAQIKHMCVSETSDNAANQTDEISAQSTRALVCLQNIAEENT